MNAQQLLDKLKQYPLAVVCVVVIFVALAVGFLRGDKLPVAQAEYDTVLQESEVMNSNRENAVDLEENLEQLTEMVAKIEDRLIDPDARTDNYRYFLGMAERAQVSLDDPSSGNMVNSAEAGLKEFAVLDFSLSATGSYDKVLRFLYELRTGHHVTRINSVSLSPARNAGGMKNPVHLVVNLSCLAVKPAKDTKNK